jgi:hypothetical protein
MPKPSNAGDGCQGGPVRGAPEARAEGPTLTAGGGVAGVGAARTPPREALSSRVASQKFLSSEPLDERIVRCALVSRQVGALAIC